MARLRLRFLLQEFDLNGPEVILGRSPDCHITIDDPMVSRRHACIRIEGEQAWVSDLGSRNGIRRNGKRVHHEVALEDGDRIRIGTQELVFCAVAEQESRLSRTTGYLTMCKMCGTPFPDSAQHCPHCGATAVVQEEETMSGVFAEPQRGWTLKLLCDVTSRALEKGSVVDADRLMRRIVREVDERLEAGEVLAPDLLLCVTEIAVALARNLHATEWVKWCIAVYRRSGAQPTGEVIERLHSLDVQALPDVLMALQSFTAWYRHHSAVRRRDLQADAQQMAVLARLEQLTGAAQA
ncbi:MAG: FHA domain-containing protein [Polyangiales bacterium]